MYTNRRWTLIFQPRTLHTLPDYSNLAAQESIARKSLSKQTNPAIYSASEYFSLPHQVKGNIHEHRFPVRAVQPRDDDVKLAREQPDYEDPYSSLKWAAIRSCLLFADVFSFLESKIIMGNRRIRMKSDKQALPPR
jgi:hypothetical protein